MDIGQNFNRNLKKAVKDQTHNLPSGSKFIFQQLLKNANQIEENLEDDNVGKDGGKGYYCRCADNTLCHSTNSSCYGQCCVGKTVMAEYNVGNLKEVINKLKEQASYQEFNNIGIYGDVGSAYTFKSQGPIPGGYTERGYNFESDGPLGVDYFNEEDELEEKTVGGKCGGRCVKNPNGPDGCGHGCKCKGSGKVGECGAGSGKRSASDSSKKIKVGDLKEVIKNLSEEKGDKCSVNCNYSHDVCPDGDDSGAKSWTAHGSVGMYGSADCSEFGYSACATHCGAPGMVVDDTPNSGPHKWAKEVIKNLSEEEKEEEVDEATTSSSSGAYVTPKFWAKKKRKNKKTKSKRKSKRKSNSKRWMPGAKFVKVKDKCKKFPYCNQGDINALELWEKNIMRESAEKVSKKTGLPEKEVRKRVEKEIEEIIRRGFYKSPVKDLVGTGKMNTPIGKMFTMKGNKPKYES